MKSPFGTLEDRGILVVFDGTCGFEAREGTLDGKPSKSLRIYALRDRKEPGENITDEDMEMNGGFCELCFTSDKSIDVVIDALNKLKGYE